MNRVLFRADAKKEPCRFRDLRGRDVVVIVVMIIVVGYPLFFVEVTLFGPSERVLSLLSTHFALSPDALTACTMLAFCITLGLAMIAGNRFLSRFLRKTD